MESGPLIGKAMGNSLRLQILEELVKGPQTLNELSTCTNLKPESILHHIRILQQVGLVEEFEPIRRGGPGRPYSRYKLTGKMVNIQYPQRNYAMLAEILLQQFPTPSSKSDSKDSTDAKERFRQIGVAVGRYTAQDASAKHGVKNWDLNSVRQFFVEDYLKELGLQPEVITADETKLHYRQYNCLFLELAKKYPDTICCIGEGLLDGLLTSMNMQANATQVKCLVRGDDCCEYVLRTKK